MSRCTTTGQRAAITNHDQRREQYIVINRQNPFHFISSSIKQPHTLPGHPNLVILTLWGPSLAGTSTSSPTYRNRATSTSDDPKGWRSYEFGDRVAQVIKRVTGEGVTEGDTTGNLVTMPVRTPYPSSTLRPSSTALWPLPAALQYSSSPHSPPLTPFLPKRRYSSLRPTFGQTKKTRNECSRTPPSSLMLNTTSPSMSPSTTQKRSSKAQI